MSSVALAFAALAATMAAGPPRHVRIEVGLDETRLKPADVLATLKADLAPPKAGPWLFAPEGGTRDDLLVKAELTSLGQGQGGYANTFVFLRLYGSEGCSQKLLAQWAGRTYDDSCLTGNPDNLAGLTGKGLIGRLSDRLHASLDRACSGPETPEALLDGITPIEPSKLGIVHFWRPDIGGAIEPSESFNLNFEPNDRLRIQAKPATDATIRLALIGPDGKIKSVYSPDLPPVTAAGRWANYPPDTTIGFGANPAPGAWKVVLLVQPTDVDAQRMFEDEVSQVWGGDVQAVAPVSPDAPRELRALATLLGAGAMDQSLRTWRKVVLPVTVVAP